MRFELVNWRDGMMTRSFADITIEKRQGMICVQVFPVQRVEVILSLS